MSIYRYLRHLNWSSTKLVIGITHSQYMSNSVPSSVSRWSHCQFDFLAHGNLSQIEVSQSSYPEHDASKSHQGYNQ